MNKRIKKAKNEIKDFFENFFKVIRRSEMIILPGNVSFFLCLAIIPTFGLISYGASILNLSVDFLYNFIANSFSEDIANLVLGVNLTNGAGIHFFITIIVGLYIASNGADAIIIASNTIYGIPQKTWLKRRLKAMWLSFLFVVLLIFMLIVPVFGNIIVTLIKEVNLNPVITERIAYIFTLLKGPISWLFMFLMIRLIYALAPNRKVKGRVINYGAIFTTVGFIIGTKIYSLYVTNYASYGVLYGGLASIVVLMIWIYYLSFIFTVGIALNSQKDENNLLKNGTIKE